MTHHCVRCKRQAPTDWFKHLWAAPHDIGGIMCPRCYDGLQLIRRRQREQYKRGMNTYMKGKP